MRLKNTTTIADTEVREIIRFVRPSGISGFDVMVKNSQHLYRGRAYHSGSGYHDTADPFIVAAIGGEKYYPHPGEDGGSSVQMRNGAYRDVALYSRVEGLVYLLAHELRHLWQAKHPRGWRSWGSRGQFSEKDAEDYAIRKLRAWRRLPAPRSQTG